MHISHRFRLSLAAAALVATSAGALAETRPTFPGDEPPTFSGSYLAGRSADLAHDLNAAAGFYADAVDADPANPALVERLLLLSLATGSMDRAFTLAGVLVKVDASNPAGRLSLAVQAIKQGKPKDALTELGKVGPAELASLTSGLATAWIEFDQGNVDAALKTIAALKGPDWYVVFTDYHTALILDAAGRTDDAVAAIGKAYGDDSSALRIVVAYARIMAHAGKKDEAIKAVTLLGGDDPSHPELRYLLADIKAGKPFPPIATDAKAGIAEALYGLGAAIGTDDGPELPAAYLRLSAYLDPTSTLTTMALGDVFLAVGRCQEAVAIYSTVPRSARIRRNADLQTGLCLEDLDKRDQAMKYFKRMLAADPNDAEAAVELGNNYRAGNHFAEAVTAYTRAIKSLGGDTEVPSADALAGPQPAEQPPTADSTASAGDQGADQTDSGVIGPAPDAGAPSSDAGAPSADAGALLAPAPAPALSPNWRVFYFRGVALEQSKRWPEAEADLKRALALNPDQSSVLNYLGYSWIDRGENLDQALALIQKAVKFKPNDGYVVDSLGWAYYKLGRYDDAVRTMEAAVQRAGGDATINDHLGDVYWTVGRKREAFFQWSYARDSSPDKDLLAKILIKLKHGLSAAPANGTTTHSSVEVEKGESLWAIAGRVYGDPKLYPRILTANRGRIANPDAIFPGMTLDIPPGSVN